HRISGPLFAASSGRARSPPGSRTQAGLKGCAVGPISSAGWPDNDMLFVDTEVKRAREHRPLSRGSRTAPSPTRVVLWSGPCLAIVRHGPGSLFGVCAQRYA